MNIRDLAIVTLKLGLSGAIIAGIAALFLVVSEDGEVTEAQADLYDMQPMSIHQHGDFERVIEDSGLEPKPYDYNGNFVNFAFGESEMSPEELLDQYQQRFKQAGINSKIYDESMFDLLMDDDASESEELTQAMDGLLQGEMVPVSIHENHIAMAGMLGSVDPEDERFHEFKKQLEAADLDRYSDPEQFARKVQEIGDQHLPDASTIGGNIYEDSIDGFRYLEAHRESGTGTSNVISSWSDGDFDANKVSDPDAEGVGADSEVPACIGCDRDNRLQALNDDDPYILNQFRTSNSHTGDIVDFYDRAMTQREWQRVDTDQGLEELQPHVPELQYMSGEMASYERGDEHLTVYIPDEFNADGERSIITMMNEGMKH